MKMHTLADRNIALITEKKHVYGIDLLRCMAMLMIVIIHLYNQGGALRAISAKNGLSWVYGLNYAFELICLGAVQLYGMISGYVMLDSKFKLSRLLSLWLQVLVIGLAICAVGKLLRPERITKEIWIYTVLPISQREYWYFSCYTGVFLLSPLLNRGIRAMTDRQAILFMHGCFALFSVISTLGYAYRGDAFSVVGGYSVLWLTVMYVFGAVIKKTGFLLNIKSWILLCVMAICFSLCLLWKFVISHGFFKQFEGLIVKYNNPIMLVFDVCLFVLISRLEIRNRVVQRLLKTVAPLTFSVYLIHVHPAVFRWLKNKAAFIADCSQWLSLPLIIGIALAVFLICILADYVRQLVFRRLRVDDFCGYVENKARAISDKFIQKTLQMKKAGK